MERLHYAQTLKIFFIWLGLAFLCPMTGKAENYPLELATVMGKLTITMPGHSAIVPWVNTHTGCVNSNYTDGAACGEAALIGQAVANYRNAGKGPVEAVCSGMEWFYTEHMKSPNGALASTFHSDCVTKGSP